MAKFERLLVANRGEIAIRIFRAAHELGIRSIGVYSHEDRFALHRFKADEAYLIGVAGEPIRSYINIPALLELAVSKKIDAIHPGYGFLSENAEFARACRDAGIVFVGPRPEVLSALGDKVAARAIADKAGVPTLTGGAEPIRDLAAAKILAASIGYPVMLKAAHGGGGRGMRVIRTEADLIRGFDPAVREATLAFGKGDVFLEKFVENARHLEVQLLGDRHGGLVHLYERDCSVQRRHQKICEIAPAPNLDPKIRRDLCDAALAVGREAGIDNAATVEFLYDLDANKVYFIEVNPRIQVEHTVTEAVTGFDLVSRQILIAQGGQLSDDDIGLGDQTAIRTNGFAIQCRVTTEDPSNEFIPDYGRILHYRSTGGVGIRLDGGNAFSGAIVTPFFDSLLVKVTAFDNRFAAAARRMERGLQEFRIRGVKTNIPFLLNLITHPEFLAGRCTTRFLDSRPELFVFQARRDRASKLLYYLGDVAVNGHPQAPKKPESVRRIPAPIPSFHLNDPIPHGTKQILQSSGPAGLARWILKQKQLLMTDTTMRDAHQSLLATRMRTIDMVKIADVYARRHSELFSLEMWGGATFDTAMRFLWECPWQRLADLRERIPNILFQMLIRASNAVGYSTYPDNVVREFIAESARAGIDVFRIFDSLNWVENMKVAIEATLESGMVCEPAICYTGDILDPKRSKYSLKYYVDLAKQLEKLGAHILGIKDMSGLCKPAAAVALVKALKQEIGIPIHFHTHDTSGAQAAAVLAAAEVDLDIADAAFAPLSGLTSQPNLNSIVECLRFTDRDTKIDIEALNRTADYWERVREFYTVFESPMRAGTAEVYRAEIPGGQFTNLQQQANSLGLGDRFHEVCGMYSKVNELFGDIVKVTPTSKVVGDMAIFMVSNDLTPADILDPAKDIAFPESVIGMFDGNLGQPVGGWPVALQQKILRGRPPKTGRPGAELAAVDFAQANQAVEAITKRPPAPGEVLSWLLYPKVFSDFISFQEKYADPSVLPTPLFFYGPVPGEEVGIELEQGKTLIVKLTAISDAHGDGTRTVFFEVNGQPREVTVIDRHIVTSETVRPIADPANPLHVASPMPGLIFAVNVQVGTTVKKDQKLASIEAMKMETTIYAERPGVIAEVLVKPGDQVKNGDLLFVFAAEKGK